METFNQRLKRYVTQSDLEIFGWMSVMFQNYYQPEIRRARENQLYLCVYLTTHAVIQMVSENMFGFRGIDGTKFFLSHYLDGAAIDRRFSVIADDIHTVRNVLTHQGYSSLQHRVEYFDDQIPEGWKTIEDTTHINPVVYAQQFEQAIAEHKFVAEYKQEPPEQRIVRKYRFIRQWLRVEKSSEINREVKKLEDLSNMPDLQAQ